MLSLALFFVLMFFSVLFSIVIMITSLVYVLFVLLFVYFARTKLCPFSLLLGVRGWLQRLLVALPGRFYFFFFFIKRNVVCIL